MDPELQLECELAQTHIMMSYDGKHLPFDNIMRFVKLLETFTFFSQS